ncbi:hypothetical protein TruAng_011955 [Truncatella angustata]|nr:hypothetical protein TruAng_011955 [Truncatella angustata]
MFEIRHAGAKGFGVFASRLIPRGSRILAERALLSINIHKTCILTAAEQLSSKDHGALMRLSLNESKHFHSPGLIFAAWQAFSFNAMAIGQGMTILNIFCNNNFALSDELGTRAVFPTAARINHSCVPNSQGNFNELLGSFTVHATRDIATGDEVTISYLHNELGLRAARQTKLQEGYGFHCGCELCSGGSQRRMESRERRTEIKTKLKAFSAQQSLLHVPDMVSHKLALTQLIIDTHEKEGLAGRALASLYSAAAGLAMQLNDFALATTLGTRALELEKDAVGIDSSFYEASQLALTQMSFPEGKALANLPYDVTPELSYAPWT